MNEIILKVREYGQKRDQTALQEYVESISVDDFQQIVTAKVNHPEFSTFWNYLLQGLNDNGDSSNKRFKIVRTTVDELKEKDVPATLSNSVMSRVFVELPKFKTEHLLDLCLLCTEYIQQGNVSELRWREFLPELLNVIVERERVEYNDMEMSGVEYKSQFINSLCMIQWSANIIIPLSSMFINVALSKEEHLQVINKLGKYVENLIPQEVPAFVYQLLRLGRHHNSRSIFLRLQNYFSTRIYNRAATDQNTNTESLDFIDSSDVDSVQAESTVLFHIYLSASLGHESIKDYLTCLKNLVKSPEVVLHPFQLSVLLTISSVPVHEEKVFEIIRASISKNFHEENKRNESYWLREMVSNPIHMETVLKRILENSLNERPSVIQGLVNLGFVLLSVGSALGRDAIAEKQWHLGKHILQSLIKEKSGVSNLIFERLTNHIITGNNASSCVDCFHYLVRKFPMVTLENKRYVIQLLDDVLLHSPEPIANLILYAIMPLTKLAPTIRDHLILLLRKALYSRVESTRMVAVKGFLKLLKNLKITNPADLSQSSNNSSSSSSGYSVLTQITLTVHGHSGPSPFTNEALCLEVLGIVRRCFMQQGEIRAELYSGLYDAVCLNPDIGGPVLDILWFHFNTYYVSDEDTLPPLHFSKITLTKDLDVTLLEPLGKLIYASGCIITKVLEKDEDHITALKFESALNSLCKRMAACEFIHFELDDGTNLLDVIPEAQQKLIILKEAMCVYEALLGYKVSSWNASSKNYAQEVQSLFQGYFRLLQFLRNLSKPKKVEKKKKDSDQTSQRSQTSIKKDGSTKSKSVKPPSSILGFEVLTKMLNLLHSNVSWTTVSQANILKTKHDLHRHIMQSTIQLLQSLKDQKIVDTRTSKMYYNYCTEISKLLYEKCIERLDDFMDFDKDTAILAVECFYLMLQFVTQNYNENLNDFMSTIVNQDKTEPMATLLKPIIETYQKLFEYEESIQTDDADLKKLLFLEINTLSLLLTKIPVAASNTLSNQFLDWLKQFASEQVVSSKAIATSFATLWFDAFIKFKSGISLFENLATDLFHVVGTISQDKEVVQKYKIVNELSALCFAQQMTSALKQLLDDVDWVIARLRSEYVMVTYSSDDGNERRRENLKNKERGVCCQLCLIITVVNLLSDVSVPAGALWEAILKTFAHVYNTLNSLTKYFILRSTKLNVVFQSARFERVIKLIGKQLSPDVNKFILYIEESQKEETNTQAKKKAGSVLKNKVLRETKLIPKVVFEMEQFSKSVIQLSNKTKVDLAKYIGPGTTRDFRIKDIKEVLERNDDHIPASLNTTNSSNDNSNLGNESSTEVNENKSDDEENETDDEAPPTKKIKK